MSSGVTLRALCLAFVFSIGHLTLAAITSPPSTSPSPSITSPQTAAPPRQVRCIESGRFYRDPSINQPQTSIPATSAAEEEEEQYQEEGRSLNGRRYQVDVWSRAECAKYYLCLEGEVFAFQCTGSLAFDVERQLCKSVGVVENCDLITDNDEDIEPDQQPSQNNPSPSSTKDQLPKSSNLDHQRDQANTKATDQTHPSIGCERSQRPCTDDSSICLPTAYFCDGSDDCPSGSDEQMCDGAEDPNAAFPCNVTACKLPDCFCSRDGTNVPGNLEARKVPQMVTLTFDDAITAESFRLYMDTIFTPGEGERTNPNGCPLTGTFFVSHLGNDYHRTQRLWNEGHEIAIHSITHRGPPEWWSSNATVEDWFDEMIGQANILHRYAKVPMQDIKGVRAPFLQVGWHRQFLMMKEFGFQYDSTIVAPAAYSEIPLWPYTLDYKMPHDCKDSKQHCPTRSFPGIWELVMNPLVGKDYTCAMVDSCPKSLTGDEVYHLLHYNFKRHYHTNRAPFGLYFHSKWFKREQYLEAFMRFLDDLLEYNDVWFLSKSQVIDWLRKPTSLDRIEAFEPWACDYVKGHQATEAKACAVPNVCKLRSNAAETDNDEMNMNTCAGCPKKYPWLKNEFGND